jgi:hypothetical protein
MDATLDPRPLGWIHTPRPPQLQSKWPRAIDPSVVPRAFASELVEAFYEQYQGLAIQDARTFESVLHIDFFNLGVRVSDKALSALTVCIQLRSRYGRAYTHDSDIAMNAALTLSHDCKYVQTNDITDCFEPLLQEKQRLANGFKLDIFLHTENYTATLLWLAGIQIDMSTHLENIARDVILALQACASVIITVKEKCRAQVRVIVSFGNGVDLLVQEEQMDYDVDEWVGVFNRLVNKPASQLGASS